MWKCTIIAVTLTKVGCNLGGMTRAKGFGSPPDYVESERSKGFSTDKMDYQEAISAKTSSKWITSNCIEDLVDRIKHKGAQKYLKSWDGKLSSMLNLVEQFGHPSEKKTKKSNSFKMLVKDHHSVNSSN